MVAFEEVEKALTSLSARKSQRAELAQQTGQLKLVATAVQAQLAAGIVSQLEVFETERQLLAAELALLANHQQILADTVTLYKALGGGWPPVDVRNGSNDARSQGK
jgi:outer membrane protein TolC